jgi:hypothetical protein
LIEIENKSRQLITSSINIVKELQSFETLARAKGKVLLDSEEYNKLRKRLVNNICQINRVLFDI